MSKTIELNVPIDFQNPIPSSFSSEEVSYVLTIGTEAMRLAKTRLDSRDGNDECLRKVEELLNSHYAHRAEEALQEQTRLKTCLQDSAHQLSVNDMRLENEMLKIRQTLEKEHKSERKELERKHTEEKRECHELTASLQKTIREKDANLETLEDEMQQLRQLRFNGKLMESDVKLILQNSGLHIVDTSVNGKKNYHDLLLAEGVLHVNANTGRYETFQRGCRLSVELKNYGANTSIGDQRVMFEERAKKMNTEERAECYLFVATRSFLPNKRRSQVDIVWFDDRPVCMGFLGAADLKQEEIVMMANVILRSQEQLGRLKKTVPFADGILENIRTLANTSLEHLQTLLERNDCILNQQTQIVKDTKLLRKQLVAFALHQMNVFHTCGLLQPTDDNKDWYEAYNSLDGEHIDHRRILRFKEEHSHAQGVKRGHDEL